MESKYCKKRKEIIKFPMPEDYCVDCQHYEVLQDCWANDLEVKFIDNGENVLKLSEFENGVTEKTSFGYCSYGKDDFPKTIYFKDGQQLDVSKMNVEITYNSIDFIGD